MLLKPRYVNTYMDKNENPQPGPYDVKMYSAPAVIVIEQDGLFAAIEGTPAEARKKYLNGEVDTWYLSYKHAIAALYDPRGSIQYDYGLREREERQHNATVFNKQENIRKSDLDVVRVEHLARTMWYGGVTRMLLGGKVVKTTALHVIEWMQEHGYITKTGPVGKYFCKEGSTHPIVYEYRPDEMHLAILAEEVNYIINEIRKDYERNN